MLTKIQEHALIKDTYKNEKFIKTVLQAFASTLCSHFKVNPDEVAILGLTSDGGSLCYLIPQELSKVAAIPVTSNRSTTAWAARNKQGRILNVINIPRSTSVFHAFRLEDITNPTQKLMVAPILAGDQLLGVIQISRKGPTLESAGPDFASKDLEELCKLAADFAYSVVRGEE